MEKNLKIIIIGLIILAILGALIFLSFDIAGPGSLIGGLAVIWAGMKSKIFGIKSSEEKVNLIKQEHTLKREEWKKAKEEYDCKFRALQSQMMYLDYRSALISEKINSLDDYQKQKIQEIEHASSDDLLRMMNERYQ